LFSNQNLRPPIGMNIIESSLVDDADDRKRPITPRDRRADSIAFWEETPSNRGVDHGFRHAILTELSKGTAVEQPQAHHLDVVRADGDEVDEHLVPIGVASVSGRAGNRDRLLISRRRKRQRRGGARPGDTGNRGQRLLDAIVECDYFTLLGEEFGRRPHPYGEHAIRSEARIRPEQPLEAADAQCATGEQNERERHLRYDHAAAPPTLSATPADRAAGEKRR